ncbi:cyclic nucleotide-gated cation channel beta-3-like isoform X2 [Octopus sinensis]|uniref:Cyclic nucleotide-gated cation channel beta-3-like isoform X2 n=1 Tax=Octopus sinensis TaxID=2607531 RepID=A0A7E6EUW5_9MOLL|nr:cyclic nucleotide-gated cation channel beta-3-like isoform X2 [Octopus sinensis]
MYTDLGPCDQDSDECISLNEFHVCNQECPLLSKGRRASLESSSSKDTSISAHQLSPFKFSKFSRDSSRLKKMGYGRSPLLSSQSAWGDQVSLPRQDSTDQTFENVSADESFNLSNVSRTLSEQMHELVRAFSSRTQRVKEKTTQPPTPTSSSLSSLEVQSASHDDNDDEKSSRQQILGSFLPISSQGSGSVSNADSDLLIKLCCCQLKLPKCLKCLRFPEILDPQSKLYMSWLALVTLAFLYNCTVIPLRGVFPYQTEDNFYYWMAMDYLCDFVYLIDIIIFKSRVQFVNEGLLETNKKIIRKKYYMGPMFKSDLASLIPLDLFYLLPHVNFNSWLRLPRMMKILTFWEFYERCDQAARSAHAVRIIKTMTYMLFLIHIETCGYYAVSDYEGIGSNRWVYNGTGNAYIRCFYLATKTATSIGNNPKPTNELEFVFMTFYWLSGVFVFALLVGQIRDIVHAAGQVEASYRKQMDITSWYMQSINLPKEVQGRVRHWFNYNWEQQKTLDENSLIETLPRKMRIDLAIHVHYSTLSKLKIFQDCDQNLLFDLVAKLRPVLCLPGDFICHKGEVGKEMYIVNNGQVEVVGGSDNNTVLATLHEGSVFGEISLLAISGSRRTADVRCKGYVNLFILSKADFNETMNDYPEAQKLLKKRAKKLLKENARLARQEAKQECEAIIKSPKETPKFLKTVMKVMNPESELMQKIESNQVNLPRLSNSNNSLQRDPHIDLSSSTDRTLSDNQVNSLSSGSLSLSDIANDYCVEDSLFGDDDVFEEDLLDLADDVSSPSSDNNSNVFLVNVETSQSTNQSTSNLCSHVSSQGLGSTSNNNNLPEVEIQAVPDNLHDFWPAPNLVKSWSHNSINVMSHLLNTEPRKRKISIHSMSNDSIPNALKTCSKISNIVPVKDISIPVENRVTCAVEVHQQECISSPVQKSISCNQLYKDEELSTKLHLVNPSSQETLIYENNNQTPDLLTQIYRNKDSTPSPKQSESSQETTC